MTTTETLIAFLMFLLVIAKWAALVIGGIIVLAVVAFVLVQSGTAGFLSAKRKFSKMLTEENAK